MTLLTRRACAIVLAGGLWIGLAAEAGAQTRSSDRLLIGVTGAAGAAKHVGGVAGGELAFQVSDRLEIFGEALWMQDVVTRHRVDLVQTITTYLQNSQGRTVSGSITAPAAYGGAGLRFMLLKDARLRPYLAVSAGAAHVALQPEFALDGSDITGVLPAFGVVAGRDLAGEVTKGAFGAGGGVRLLNSGYYLDAIVRLTRIQTPGRPTNVVHAGATFGLRF